MRNFKKFLALVLAMLMVVSAAATVSAFSDVAEDNQYNAAIADLVEKGIVNGVGDDKFDPDGSVERYQMALMVARALDPDKTNEEWATGMSIFTDVTEWYGAINYAYMNGIVTGIGNLQFAPHAGIRYQDALIMALRALGYTVDVSGDPYWLAAYNQAAKIGLTKNVAVTKGDHELTRAETAQVIYNMLYTTPADGGLTIAAKNFGEATVKNTTTVVITGTGSQAYTGKGEALVDDTYVTVQVLNEDGTLGDGFFTKFDKLNFAEDVKPDDVIGYSVGLVNLNGTDFDRAIPGKATVLTNTSENVKVDGKKITIDGKVYYLVDEFSKSTIKNELIVKDDSGVIATNTLNTASDLLFNKNGDVVNSKGDVLAVKSDVTSRNGQTLYALKSQADKDAFLLYTADELIKVDEIAKEYNKVDSVTGYSDVASLSGAFQITLFDDNGDNKYDRAIITPIYMSVFNNKDGKAVNIETAAFKKSEEGVTFTKDLKKGDIFVYTYNKQTKVVNVLATLDVQYGTVERINLTADEAKDFTVKISGETYKLGAPNDGAAVGAALQKTANADDKLNQVGTSTINNIVSEPALAYTTVTRFIEDTDVRNTVKFYAYNGYIVYAESYNVEDAFNLVAVKSINNYSSKAIIADIYVDGKLVNDAEISEIYNTTTKKTVKLADLNTWALTKALNSFDGSENKIFKGIKLEDGSYRLGINLTAANAKDDFGYTEYAVNGDVVFYDNVSDRDATSGANRIRTNDDTVFYFVNGDDLKVAVTAGKNSVIYVNNNNTNNTKIFVDKLGYGDKGGVASKVIVFNYNSLDGFGLTSTAATIAYIPKAINLSKVDSDDAEAFGLTGYTGTYYYYKNVAIDMSNGGTVSIYSSKKLENNKAYEIDANGVAVVKDGDLVKYDLTYTKKFGNDKIGKNDIKLDNRYAEVGNLFDQEDEVKTIVAQDMNGEKVDAKKGGDFAKFFENKALNIYYLAKDGVVTDLKDGIFVAIVETETTPVTPDPVTPAKNASWGWGSDEASITTNLPAVVGTDDKGNTTITLYDDETGKLSSAKKAENITTKSVVKRGEDGNYDPAKNTVNVQISASFKDAVLTVTNECTDIHGLPFELESGAYQVTFELINADTGSYIDVVYYVTVK